MTTGSPTEHHCPTEASSRRTSWLKIAPSHDANECSTLSYICRCRFRPADISRVAAFLLAGYITPSDHSYDVEQADMSSSGLLPDPAITAARIMSAPMSGRRGQFLPHNWFFSRARMRRLRAVMRPLVCEPGFPMACPMELGVGIPPILN